MLRFFDHVNEFGNCFWCVHLCCMRLESAAALCRHIESVRMGRNILSDRFFAFSAVVYVRSIHECDSCLISCFQDLHGFFIEGFSPLCAKLLCAESDFGNCSACFPQYTLFHMIHTSPVSLLLHIPVTAWGVTHLPFCMYNGFIEGNRLWQKTNYQNSWKCRKICWRRWN